MVIKYYFEVYVILKALCFYIYLLTIKTKIVENQAACFGRMGNLSNFCEETIELIRVESNARPPLTNFDRQLFHETTHFMCLLARP